MNTPVNFEIATLLKEKRYNDSSCNYVYAYGTQGVIENIAEIDNSNDMGYYLAPTIAEVVMWLYEKHHIWIFIQPQDLIGLNKDKESYDWYYTIIHCEGINSKYYGSLTEAYEAAIEYVLKNLI